MSNRETLDAELLAAVEAAVREAAQDEMPADDAPEWLSPASAAFLIVAVLAGGVGALKILEVM